MMKSVGIAIAALAAAGAARAADPAPQFLQETISGALSEIMLGQLAGRTSDSAEVRAFGRALAEDQTAVELKAISLAGPMGVAAPTRATDAGRQAYARLQALSGRDFDQAFLSGAAARLRQQIAAFRRVAADRKSPASDLARDALPALQARLEAAEALQRGG